MRGGGSLPVVFLLPLLPLLPSSWPAASDRQRIFDGIPRPIPDPLALAWLVLLLLLVLTWPCSAGFWGSGFLALLWGWVSFPACAARPSLAGPGLSLPVCSTQQPLLPPLPPLPNRAFSFLFAFTPSLFVDAATTIGRDGVKGPAATHEERHLGPLTAAAAQMLGRGGQGPDQDHHHHHRHYHHRSLASATDGAAPQQQRKHHRRNAPRASTAWSGADRCCSPSQCSLASVSTAFTEVSLGRALIAFVLLVSSWSFHLIHSHPRPLVARSLDDDDSDNTPNTEIREDAPWRSLTSQQQFDSSDVRMEPRRACRARGTRGRRHSQRPRQHQ